MNDDTDYVDGWLLREEDFERVSEKEFDETLQLIADEKHEEYSGYFETDSIKEFDFQYGLPHYITDGKRYAMLSLD